MADIRRIMTYANNARCYAEVHIPNRPKRFINFAISGTETREELTEMAQREAREVEAAMTRAG